MLIASIAIAMTYTVYTIVVKAYGSYHAKNKDLAVIIRLDELLKKDFEHAGIVLKNANGLSFKSTDRNVAYAIGPDFIIRNSAIADTFNVKLRDVNLAFENTPVIEVAETEESNRVDELWFNLLVEDQKISYHYAKRYSSANLIQRKNAVN